MCDTPDKPPELRAAHIENKDTEENRQKVKADFERELLLYIMMKLQDMGLITAKVYENAVNIILRQ